MASGRDTRTAKWRRFLLLKGTRLRLQGRAFHQRHPFATPASGLAALGASTWALAALAKPWTSTFYSTAANFAALKAFFLGLGSALVGATALVFTLILFAMQVNVGRMPTPLFSRFASDKGLLAAFMVTLMFSISVAALSLSNLPTQSHWLVAAASWATFLTVMGFILAYRRAISLTSPLSQIQHVVKVARANLRRWGGLANASVDQLGETPAEGTFDARRLAFFKLNQGWDQEARELCEQVVSYGGRLTETGDHESFKAMLQGVVAIHASYVRTRGASFINSNPLFELPDARDPFLLSTLERLRLTATGAAKRGDEQTCMLCFQAHTDLFGVYSKIAYSGTGDHRYHANLISGYLQSQVEAAARHGMPDVAMEGARQIGTIAKRFITEGLDAEGSQPVKKLATLAVLGAVSQPHRPVTQTAMQQLAQATYVALLSDHPYGHHIFNAIRDAAFSSGSTFVQMTEELSGLSSTHKGFLGPYFSTSDTGTLLHLISQATGALLSGDLGGKEALFITGLSRWSSDLHRPLKDLLLQSLGKPSSITFDLIHWPSLVANLLLETCTSEHCDVRTRATLTENALALTAVYSWIPSDEATTGRVEATQLREILFELAHSAAAHGAVDVCASAQRTLLRWTVDAGRHNRGWGTLDQGLLTLTALSAHLGEPEDQLSIQLTAALAGQTDYPAEKRTRAARELRREATLFRGGDMRLRLSERILAELGQPSLARRLNLIADVLEAA